MAVYFRIASFVPSVDGLAFLVPDVLAVVRSRRSRSFPVCLCCSELSIETHDNRSASLLPCLRSSCFGAFALQAHCYPLWGSSFLLYPKPYLGFCTIRSVMRRCNRRGHRKHVRRCFSKASGLRPSVSSCPVPGPRIRHLKFPVSLLRKYC